MPERQQSSARGSNQASSAEGVFLAGALYSFPELRRRGFGATLLREMQKAGLATKKCGRMKFVLGSDLLGYFAALPVEPIAGSR